MKQTPAEKLQARHTASLQTASALKLAALKSRFIREQQELRSLAARIELCGSKANQFIVPEAFDKNTGEVFEAVGSLWKCGSKLCATCLADQSRRNRKKLREAVAAQKLRKGERYYFITFTIPNPRLGLLATRAIVDRAWTLFRKRKMCVDLIRGGVKTEEFTLTANGFHYHLHTIVKSLFLSYSEVRRNWTECVEKAFAEAGVRFETNSKSNTVRINVKPIRITEKSLHEVCKYVTKSDSWMKMPADDLTDIAMIRRWCRMFELFGEFSMSNREKTASECEQSERSSNVHTSYISDGASPSSRPYWRDFVNEHGYEAYRHELEAEVGEAWIARMEQLKLRYPGAVIKFGLNDFDPVA